MDITEVPALEARTKQQGWPGEATALPTKSCLPFGYQVNSELLMANLWQEIFRVWLQQTGPSFGALGTTDLALPRLGAELLVAAGMGRG